MRMSTDEMLAEVEKAFKATGTRTVRIVFKCEDDFDQRLVGLFLRGNGRVWIIPPEAAFFLEAFLLSGVWERGNWKKMTIEFSVGWPLIAEAFRLITPALSEAKNVFIGHILGEPS